MVLGKAQLSKALLLRHQSLLLIRRLLKRCKKLNKLRRRLLKLLQRRVLQALRKQVRQLRQNLLLKRMRRREPLRLLLQRQRYE
jgi:single-stranded DNA-specific DHH superfamily exonuclease